MGVQTAVTIMIAVVPFLAVWVLLELSRRLARSREDRIARQIALTDAIHRELGAVAAPEVRRDFMGVWIVSVRLPLQREGVVGAITRITHDFFRRVDRRETPRLRLVLIPQEPRPWRRPTAAESTRSSGGLSRAA